MGYVGLTPWFTNEPWRSVVDQGRGIDLGRRRTRTPGTCQPGFDLDL